MRSLIIGIVFIACFVSTSTSAADDGLAAIDFVNCNWWQIAQQNLQNDDKAIVRALFDKAKLLGMGWSVWATSVVQSADGDPRKNAYYSICYRDQNKFECPSGVQYRPPSEDFPFSGATYEYRTDKNHMTTYFCVKGCQSALLKKIYGLGYESEKKNLEYLHDLAYAKRVCGNRAKRWDEGG